MYTGFKKYSRLERYFNKFRFDGVPIGGTLSDLYFKDLNHGLRGQISPLKLALNEVLGIIRSLFLNPRVLSFTVVLSTRLVDKMHLNKMIEPLMKHFSTSLTLLYNPKIKIDSSDNNLISLKETHITPKKDLLLLMSFGITIFFKVFFNRKRLELTINDVFTYCFMAFHQARIISYFNFQFCHCEFLPKVVLTEFDRNSVAAPLINSANKHGIQTVTLVHGLINNFGYTPVLAKHIFCFGEIQKQKLIDLYVPMNKIKITGTPIIKEISQPKDKLTTAKKQLVICLGINPIGDDGINFMINVCLETINRFHDCKLVIKLHPSQNKTQIINHVIPSSRISIYESSEIDNEELFTQIDMLIIYNSGLGIEAMLNKVFVATINLPVVKNLTTDLYDNAGCPTISSSKELGALVELYYNDPILLQKYTLKMYNYAKQYFYLTGEEAANAIIKEVENLVIQS